MDSTPFFAFLLKLFGKVLNANVFSNRLILIVKQFFTLLEQAMVTKYSYVKQRFQGAIKPVLLVFMVCVAFVQSSLVYSQAADSSQTSVSPELIALSQTLAKAKLRQKSAIVKKLEQQGQESVVPLFKAMVNGDLYHRKSDKLLFKLVTEGETLSAINVLDGSVIDKPVKKAFKKVRVNNSLRVQLRQAIARLSLSSANREVRLNAVEEMMEKMDAGNAAELKLAAAKETDEEILKQISLALAIHSLQSSDDVAEKIAALNTVDGSLEPAARKALNRLLVVDDEGTPLEPNTEVREKAERVLAAIDARIKRFQRVEQLFFGLSLGSVFLLIATGLAITFGVMGVINMAHGELMMLGAYTTYVVQLLMPNHIEYSLFVAIPAAFLVSGLVGVLMERSVIRFLHGRPLETLLATFGISLILQQAVRTIFSPLNRPVQAPDWMSGSLEINEVLSLTYNRLYILIFALLVFAVLQLVLKRSSLGLHVRAVSQNRDMAKAIGIRTSWVDAMTFGLGSGIAGIAGVALSQLTNVGPNLGQAYIIDSFMVVVFGGAGNLWGTLVAGFTLGVSNKFLEPITGAVLANILVLVFIILFIQKRPRGLFPQKGRAAE